MVRLVRHISKYFWGLREVDRDGSVTHLIDQAKSGNSNAAHQLWDRYFEQAVRVANQKLSPQMRRVADGEDIALSAFHSLFQRVKSDQFARFESRDDLWKLLSKITRRKAINHYHAEMAQKRGSGQVRGESVLAGIDLNGEEATGIAQFAGNEPTPEFIHEMADLCRHLLEMLASDELREIALLRFEGYTNREIAKRLAKGERAIERKAHIIRQTWKHHLLEE